MTSGRATGPRVGERGQALVETMLMMTFLCFMIFGFVHFCMLAATKSVVDLAAFSAARTVMVRSWNPSVELPVVGDWTWNIPLWMRSQAGLPAAWQVLQNLRWWTRDGSNPNCYGAFEDSGPDCPVGIATINGQDGLTVTYRVPFGMLLFGSSGDSQSVAVTAFAPLALQPEIAETGDNAR